MANESTDDVKNWSTEEKRWIIYASERLKALAAEKKSLNAELAVSKKIAGDLDEGQKRRRLYIGERLNLLQAEQADLLERRTVLLG